MPKPVSTSCQGARCGNTSETSSHHGCPSEPGAGRAELFLGAWWPCQVSPRCHSPAAAASVGEQEEVPDLERGLSWWRSHWSRRLPWGTCSSPGRCARSEGSGRTWTAVALSSLPQTACRPSLQGKERSHSLPLACKPQLRVSRIILRRAPRLCSQGAHVVAIHPAGKDPNIPSCEPAHNNHHPRPQTQLTELWNQWGLQTWEVWFTDA